jgi:ribosomal protein L11 methyltransferase
VEPGLAFGTGEHPTTSMCLVALESLVQRQFNPQRILDLGAGTGVLGILALKLWPNAKVDFVDNDPLCKQEIEKNFGLNKLPINSQVRISLNMLEESPTYDLVISNIYGEVLTVLASQVFRVLQKPHGLWMASGILQGNPEEMVSKKALEIGFQESDRRTQDHEQETWVFRLWGLPKNHVKSSS